MPAVLFALAPVFALVVIGWAARRFGLLGPGFWAGADKLVYWILFPALLFARAAEAPLTGPEMTVMAAMLGGAIVAAALCLIAARRALPVTDAAFGAIFQGGIRQNTYLAFAVAGALLGAADGAALAALGATVMVPLVNVFAVAVLIAYGPPGQAGGAREIVKGTLANPLVLAIAGGAAVNLAGLSLPPVIAPTLDFLGSAALPVALLCVGAGLTLDAARRAPLGIAVAAAVKFALLPGFAIAIGLASGMAGPAALAAVIYAAAPSSASSYALARILKADAPLMAAILSAQILIAAVTLPLTLSLSIKLFDVPVAAGLF